MSGTRYPSGIDGTTQLPLVADLVSAIQADDVNRIRDAVVAIETELGANPSGTFGTVKDRLDALDLVVTTLSDGYDVMSLFTDFMSGHVETPSDKVYYIGMNMPFRGYIDSVTTRATSGTATATVKINGVALGGSANAVSSTEVVEVHTSSNTFVVGDDVTFEISSNSSTADLRFTVVFIRT